jgi:predicted molibdopterin-dependent oxidoreductase YjgC
MSLEFSLTMLAPLLHVMNASQRSSSDYNKLARASGHQGASDPGLFTCHLKGVADVLSMDEVIQFVESHKLNIDLRDGKTTVTLLRIFSYYLTSSVHNDSNHGLVYITHTCTLSP